MFKLAQKAFTFNNTCTLVSIILLMGSNVVYSQTISSLIPVADTSVHEVSMSSAFDGANYLVGIKGSTNDSYEACAQLMSSSGTKVSSLIQTGHLVSNSESRFAPLLAFGNGQYLMVWTDSENDHVTTGMDVYGQFYSTTGDPIGSPFPIAESSGDDIVADVASDGTGFLVIWTTNYDLMGRLVSSNGSLGYSEVFSSDYRPSTPAIGFGGGQYLVTWMGKSHPFDHIDKHPIACLYSTTGIMGNYTVLGSAPSEYNPMNVSYGDGRFLVAWHYKPTDMDDWDIHGRFVLPNGTLIGANEMTLISSAIEDYAMGRCVVYDCDYFLIIWTEALSFGATSGITYGQYFDSNGNAKGPAFVIDSSPGGGFKLGLGASASQGKAMALILTDVMGSSGDVYGVLIDSNRIYIDLQQTGIGELELSFNGIVESTTNLAFGIWDELSPQPDSPWNFIPSEQARFFKVTNDSASTIVFDHDFSTGFYDGNLVFQNDWRGQSYSWVDATEGVVSNDAAWTRNMHSLAVTNGFAVGEGVRITVDYYFTLGYYSTYNDLIHIGLTDELPTPNNNWEARPKIGCAVQYNMWQETEGGGVKIFADWNDTIDTDAAIVTGRSMGLDPAPLGSGDLDSDCMRIAWTAIATATDTWKLAMSVINLTSGGEIIVAPEQTINYSTSSNAYAAIQFNFNQKGSFCYLKSVKYETIQEPTVSFPCPVPKTGQTASYRTGDDGDLESGAAWPDPRFTDNSDGTVLDNLTGLMWIKMPHSLSSNNIPNFGWNTAIDFCNELSFAGYTDWRLPNIKEFESLIRSAAFNVYDGPYEWLNSAQTPFSGIQGQGIESASYWSSSRNSSDYAWYLPMNSGKIYGTLVEYGLYIWPVRNEIDTAPAPVPKTGIITSYRTGDDGDVKAGINWPTPRFTDNGDGTVLDNLTGLEWSKSLRGEKKWSSAIDYCSALNYAGHSDWRLPSKKELLSLVDYSRPYSMLPIGSPFTGVWNESCWTANAPNQFVAWVLHMSSGGCDYMNQDIQFYVWPVRGGM